MVSGSQLEGSRPENPILLEIRRAFSWCAPNFTGSKRPDAGVMQKLREGGVKCRHRHLITAPNDMASPKNALKLLLNECF
ncbi:hypothetical protein AVEN_77281-1 [Araneus ventricosus]|uniref:Uncharacterized protein n=1 Tax=Araneus ventricosus TaxID=182803 RepID=A0A4Y2H1C8_ARAVE|nr:hypothetical protein AVEN_77281-1 [Araneus ventricosus]